MRRLALASSPVQKWFNMQFSPRIGDPLYSNVASLVYANSLLALPSQFVKQGENLSELNSHFYCSTYARFALRQRQRQSQLNLYTQFIDGGERWGLRYCGIGPFFIRYFGNLNLYVRYCGVI